MKNKFITILAIASLTEGASAALSALTLVSSTNTSAQYTGVVGGTTVTFNVTAANYASTVIWSTNGQNISAYTNLGYSGPSVFTVESNYNLSSVGTDALAFFGSVNGANSNGTRQNRVNKNATLTLSSAVISPGGFDSAADNSPTSLTESGTSVTVVTQNPATGLVLSTSLTVRDNFTGTPKTSLFSFTYKPATSVGAGDTTELIFGVTAGAATIIPEPTSAMLMSVATAAALMLRCRRR